MADIRPFRGWRFDARKTGTLDDVITPPYDVISSAERRTLAAHPFSMVHVILPEADAQGSPYEAAARIMNDWAEQGALCQDNAPSYYLLEQRFQHGTAAESVRRGFFAVTRIPEAGEQAILGHERTFAKPVEDRLALTRATRANLGPVFVLYSDPNRALADFYRQMEQRPPDTEARTFEGTLHRLWRVAPDPAVAAFLRDKTLYIADGHHRFRTAQTYRDEMRAQHPDAGEQPYDYVLMGFVAMEDPGLHIYPTHRVIAAAPGLDTRTLPATLQPWFDVVSAGEDLTDMLAADPATCAIGMVTEHGAYVLRLRDIDRTELLGSDRGPAWRDLDVAVLHRGILERLLGLLAEAQHQYEKDADAAVAAVQQGEAPLAFILRATRPDQVRACAETHEPMPQKSTYFFPKLPTGAVLHRFA